EGLCFLGIAIGLFLASPLVFLIRHLAAKAMEKAKAEGKDKLAPEFRLWFAMIGAPSIPISMFWMGWTSDSNISIWSPLGASVLFGLVSCASSSAVTNTSLMRTRSMPLLLWHLSR
ncbi:hypothetical protein KCV02_g7037, partial [Aureobasidium melanogenum]